MCDFKGLASRISIFVLTVIISSGCGLSKSLMGTRQLASSVTVQVNNSALTQQAMSFLNTNCASCHGSNSGGMGAFSSIGNVPLMVSQGFIVPGNPKASMLIKRASDGTMAPGNPVSAANLTMLSNWITTEIKLVVTTGPAPAPSPVPSVSPSPDPNVPTNVSALSQTALTLLDKNCGACHGPNGTNQGNFGYILDMNQLVANRLVVPGNPGASPLYQRVLPGGGMPPGGALSSADLATLNSWITTEFASITPPPPLPPLGPTYASLAANIFQPKCVSCHSRFSTYSGVAGNTGDILQEVSSGQMPPGAPLSSQEIQAIKGWINGGALNN